MSPGSLRFLFLGCSFLLLSISGCGGCSQKELEKSDNGEKDPQPVVIIVEPKPLPHGNEVNRMLVKPGHVAEMQQEFRVGAQDINGRVEGQTFSKSGQPLPVPGSRWSLNFTRDASFPSGQTKRIDLRVFISPSLEKDENSTVPINPDLRTLLIDRTTGTPIVSPRPTPTTPIPGHQYFFVVLSDHRDDYEYLSKTDLVSWPSLEVWDGDLQAAYQLVLCNRNGDRWMLPSTFFGWTTTAFVIWDDIDPNTLTSTQKQAIIDWIHWGGQLIISGPGSMSRLNGSFLDPYLPLRESKTLPLAQENLDFLNKSWALREPTSSRLMPRGQLLPETPPAETTSKPLDGASVFSNASADTATDEYVFINSESKDPLDQLGPLPDRVIPGIQGVLTSDSRWLFGADKLVCEKPVGRGRVVLSTIPLSEPFFSHWRSFPGFINATMLGRPPRIWQENSFNSRMTWKHTPNQEADSRLATRLRITTRDAIVGSFDDDVLFKESPVKSRTELKWNNVTNAGSVVSGWDGDPINGIGAWNSSSSASNAAKTILRKAAGINVPNIRTIMWMLLVYLVCMVPLNWFIFFLLGRLEWAWATVPFIALAGAGVVTYVAQLDIGFARSYTEVAVVEAFADHPRAHVTRYSAIYSSLSTPYKLTLDSDSGLTVPMISREREISDTLVETVRFDYGSADGNFLYPLNILSNSTTFLHTEQMIELGGPIRFSTDDPTSSAFTVENQSNYSWNAMAAVRRNSSGLLEAGWIGDLETGTTQSANFSTAGMTQLANHWRWRVAERRRGPEEKVDEYRTQFSEMVRVLSGLTSIRSGETRILAFAPNSPGGLQVEPDSGSVLKYAVLVLHVRSGEYPPGEADQSLPTRQMTTENQKREADEPAEDQGNTSEATSTSLPDASMPTDATPTDSSTLKQ
jgi:hypothetical protein